MAEDKGIQEMAKSQLNREVNEGWPKENVKMKKKKENEVDKVGALTYFWSWWCS